MTYELLAELAQPRRPRDLSAIWERLTPLETINGAVAEMIDHLCSVKGITRAALAAQGARVALKRSGEAQLAFAGYGDYRGAQTVTAIKYRSITTGKRSAEMGSVFVQATVIGNEHSLDWFIAEGETDAARLWDLVGDVAAIFILPAGASSFHQHWFDYVPSGATMYLCHDADEAGDKGALKLGRTQNRSIRIRPPDRCKDWCMWRGTRDEFVEIVRQAKHDIWLSIKTEKEAFEQLLEDQTEARKPIRLGWGSVDRDIRGISDGQVLGIAARAAVGKTWMLTSIVDNMASTDYGLMVCTLEMPMTEFLVRQLAIFEGVSTMDIEARRFQEHDKPVAFFNKMENVLLCERQVRLSDFSNFIAGARSRLNVPLRCVYIDYLGLIGSNGKDAYERASAIGKGLKDLAKEERIAIIVAMQLSRMGGGGGTEVSMEMMRDSGVIEESMDFLLGVWRPSLDPVAKEAQQDDWKNALCVKVIKNRKGASGRKVTMQFHEPSMKVIELATA